jgi:hypothetical protein
MMMSIYINAGEAVDFKGTLRERERGERKGMIDG